MVSFVQSSMASGCVSCEGKECLQTSAMTIGNRTSMNQGDGRGRGEARDHRRLPERSQTALFSIDPHARPCARTAFCCQPDHEMYRHKFCWYSTASPRPVCMRPGHAPLATPCLATPCLETRTFASVASGIKRGPKADRRGDKPARDGQQASR